MTLPRHMHPKITALVLLSVFLFSFFGLLLQISITRIFSIYLWYHYSFAVVSIALFGWGAGGLLVLFLFNKRKHDEVKFTSVLLAILGALTPLYVVVLPFVPLSVIWFYLLSILPFLIAGIGIAYIYSRFAHLSDKLYFSDLIGASFACILAEPIVTSFGIESAIIFLGVLVSLLFLATSLLTRAKKRVISAITICAVVSILLVSNLQFSFISIGTVPGKDLYNTLTNNPNLKVVRTMWNSISRIDVVEGFSSQSRILASIYIDADASTEILRWNGNRSDLNDLPASLDILPYSLVKSNTTLVVGPGGGKDILYSLVGGSAKVVGVELNPLIVQVVNGYGKEAGDIYLKNQDVSLVVDEGRSFIRRSDIKYDVISLTLVDTWASVYGGGYALAENYLYTKEAFSDYINHLSNDGVLMMIRWSDEIPKLVSTLTDACTSMGANKTEIRSHMAVIFNDVAPGRTKALLIFKKSALTLPEANKLKDQMTSLGASYWAPFIPYVTEDSEPYKSFFNNSITNDEFYNSFTIMAKPATDDSPYHFNFDFGIPKTLSDLLVVSLILTCGFIAVPASVSMVKSRGLAKKRIGNATLLSILIVSLLGIGYITIEITMMQRFILFLGYPTRALSVILFSLLLSSGIGSLTIGRIIRTERRIAVGMILALFSITAITCLYAVGLPIVFNVMISQTAVARIAVSILLLFPLGFVMGIPFPSTLRLMSNRPETNQQVSWLWGVNGATSVLASIITTIIGMLSGYSFALLLGACVYGLALTTALVLRAKLASNISLQSVS